MKRSLKTSAALVAIASGAALAQPDDGRWVATPDQLTAPYGESDQRGALNLQTNESVQQALALAKTGEVLSLAIPLSRETPAYGWRRFQVTVAQNEGTGHSNNEDIVSAPINTGTQIDGLAHMGIDGHFYGGHRGEDIQAVGGLKKLGIEHAGPIVARGIILDIPGVKGVERLEIGYVITVTDIEAALSRQGIGAIRTGDVVIFHTGHRRLLDEGDTKAFLSGQPGPGIEAARYLADQGVIAVGGDSGSVEAMPFETPGLLFPVHQTLLAQRGVYLMENIATERLIAGEWSEFLFVAAPLPIVGASSSWINPIAIR